MYKRPEVSSASHVVEPSDRRLDRINPKYGDSISHLETGEPHAQWYCDGQGVGVLGGISQAVKRYSNPQDIIVEGSFANAPPGESDTHSHVKDLDTDGIYADILYLSIGLNILGLRGAMISLYTRSSATYDSPIYESLWATNCARLYNLN